MNPHLIVATGLLALALGGNAAEVTDDLGRAVTLAHDARRVITLSPHATELVVAAGLRHALVGVVDNGDNPAELRGIPHIGQAGALDRERLLRLRPDLVIAWHSGNRSTDLAWLAQQPAALYLSEPATLQQIADSIRAIGRLGGTETIAERSARAFEHAIDSDCMALPPRPVYVEVWSNPAMTVGGQHWLNAALAAAGYHNHFAAEPRGVFAVADEARFAARHLPRISLIRTFDDSPADRLARQLSIPAPQLADAIQQLCKRRIAQ